MFGGNFVGQKRATCQQIIAVVGEFPLQMLPINKKGLRENPQTLVFIGGPRRIRTSDLPVMSRGLYQLSYRPARSAFDKTA